MYPNLSPPPSLPTCPPPAPNDGRTGWIYLLRKEELKTELGKFNLDTSGSVKELTKRLVSFIRDGRASPQPTTQGFGYPSVTTTTHTWKAVTVTEVTTTTTCLTWTSSSSWNSGNTILTTAIGNPIPSIQTPTVTVTPPVATAPITIYVTSNSVTPTYVAISTQTAMPQAIPPSFYMPPVTCHIPQAVQFAAPMPQAAPSSMCMPASTSYPPLDVQKWNIHFDDRSDPTTFMERLEEIFSAQNIDPDRLLPFLPEFFRGNAALWCRNNRHSWRTWTDFCQAFRGFYFPINYEDDLEAQISRRLQRPHEPANRYITDLQTLIRRHGNIGPDQEIRWIYRNLLPEYRQNIRRNEFTDVQSLATAVRECEILLAEIKNSNRKVNFRPDSDRTVEQVRIEPVRVLQPSTRRTGNTTDRTIRPTSASGTTPSDNPPRTETQCWRCGQNGHIRSQCRAAPRLFCSRCGKDGVMSRDCPCPRPEN